MLQDDFYEYVKAAYSQKRIDLHRRETQKWHKLYVNDKSICWMQKPNRDGSFWVFVSSSSEGIISVLTGLKVEQSKGDMRKYIVSIIGTHMLPIELLDRGISATGGWEASWPVGFKINDKNQFELAKRIILSQ